MGVILGMIPVFALLLIIRLPLDLTFFTSTSSIA